MEIEEWSSVSGHETSSTCLGELVMAAARRWSWVTLMQIPIVVAGPCTL